MMMKKFLLLLLSACAWCFTGKTILAQQDYDSVTFEYPVNKILIENSGDNIWQIGTPQKTFFDSAHSGAKAIVTDTLNYYPPDNTSRFIYIIRHPYTQTCYTSMEFWHKYDMDPNGDKGIIEASYDGGYSWEEVKDTSNYDPWWGTYFMWEADYHESTGEYTQHPVTTTGTSDGWIKSMFIWQWWIPVLSADSIIINPDSLMIRFTFISDGITENKEGWMIDDILTYSGDWTQCSSINENSPEKALSVSPNPFSSRTSLQCSFPIQDAELTICNISGQIVRHLSHLHDQGTIIDRDNLPAGIYFLFLAEDHKMLAKEKLIIMEAGK
jgi:hypothetical protein